MAPTKAEVKAIKTRCAAVKKAVEHSECPDRVKKILGHTLAHTAGTPKADRHPFNERFVAMIEQVLNAEQARLTGVVASNEASFNELSSGKAAREAAVEQAKTVAAEHSAALDAAKHAVTDGAASVKAAAAALGEAKKAQKTGDEELDGITVKKTMLEDTVRDSLAHVGAGCVSDEGDKLKNVKIVIGTAKSFGFDSSLISTSGQVLLKATAERGTFDMTCLQQLEDAFKSAIAKFDEELATGAPDKAARASAVEQADAHKQAAEASQADLKEKAASAKTASAAAAAAASAAAKSLADFVPDLKAAGDAFDDSKDHLQAFVSGPAVMFAELKEFKDGDFKPIPKPKKVVAEVAEAADDAAAPEAPQEDAESPSKRARTE